MDKCAVRRSMATAAGLITLACGTAPPPSPSAGFMPTVTASAPAPSATPPGMVWIPGGEFSMGIDASSESLNDLPGITRDAQPIHRVAVDGFWMDVTEVTNEAFAAFVTATGYVTIAERQPNPADFPGAPKELLVPGSGVFTPPNQAVDIRNPLQWWRYVPGASWRHPDGPSSAWQGRPKDPVVHVAYADAEAYAVWAKRRLPTEAEWEFAARGGAAGNLYPWGNNAPASGHHANTHQGSFPQHDAAADGFAGRAAVMQFPPNAYGLYDMAGNVWEWVSDWYRPDYYATLAASSSVARNPKGPPDSLDPAEPGAPKRVQRGGSFLCTSQYCARYLVGSRGKGEVSTGSSHVGFRTVKGARD